MLHGGHPESIFADRLQATIAGARRILDIGTSQRFAKELRPYERWFDGRCYIAAGYRPQPIYGRYNCDCHQDIHAMTFQDDSFDALICIEVLEHVADPFQAAREIRRVLRPGGRLLLTTPFLTGYHGKAAASHNPSHSSYPDFWRFTHQGLASLFGGFTRLEVLPLDGPIELRLKLAHLEPLIRVPTLRHLLDQIDRPRAGRATTRHLLWGVR